MYHASSRDNVLVHANDLQKFPERIKSKETCADGASTRVLIRS